MIIEFFGPPGAGKTTIAQALTESAGAKLVNLAGRRERYWFDLIYLFHHPINFYRLLITALSQSQWSFKLLRHTLHRLSFAAALVAKAQQLSVGNNLVILDEGLAQFFFALHQSPVPWPKIESYFWRYAQNRLLVLITAPVSVCLDRMRRRGRIPRFHTGLNLEQWFKTINFHTGLIIKRNAALKHLLILNSDCVTTTLAIKKLNDIIQLL